MKIHYNTKEREKDDAISLAEIHKEVNAVQRALCSVENQKGAIAIYPLYSNSALLVLNGTSFNNVNALLALN